MKRDPFPRAFLRNIDNSHDVREAERSAFGFLVSVNASIRSVFEGVSSLLDSITVALRSGRTMMFM